MDKKKVKPFKTYEEQIELLRSRNLIIEDEVFAKQKLSNINYYRLINGYGLEFLDKETQLYKKGTSFQKIYDIYEFDRQLRQCLYSYIEIIEVRLRTVLSYYFAEKYGPLGYLNGENFSKDYRINEFLNKFEKEKERQRISDIVTHHENYEGMPIWAVAELLPMNTWSTFYSFMKQEDKNNVANILTSNSIYKVTDFYITNWLHQIVKLRNICAHYSRLYNRPFADMKLMSDYDKKLKNPKWQNKRLFTIIIAMIKLLNEKLVSTHFLTLIGNIIEYFTEKKVTRIDTDTYTLKCVDIYKVGFSENWEEILEDAINSLK